MEPLTPNDPLWNLLGKARPVEPRGNFVQNVVRAARQTPQDLGWWAALRGWWSDRELGYAPLAWSAAAVMALSGLVLLTGPQQAPQMAVRPIAEEATLSEADFLMPEFETEWKDLQQMGDVLVVQDTAQLTDSEIRMLLY